MSCVLYPERARGVGRSIQAFSQAWLDLQTSSSYQSHIYLLYRRARGRSIHLLAQKPFRGLSIPSLLSGIWYPVAYGSTLFSMIFPLNISVDYFYSNFVQHCQHFGNSSHTKLTTLIPSSPTSLQTYAKGIISCSKQLEIPCLPHSALPTLLSSNVCPYRTNRANYLSLGTGYDFDLTSYVPKMLIVHLHLSFASSSVQV